MYSDREVLDDPLDYVHSSLSQGNKVIFYQKECYRRPISCPASTSSSVTNLDSCGKLDSPATSVPFAFGSRSNSSSSVDSVAKQSRTLVNDDWEEGEAEVFEDVTKPSPGAKKFGATLSDAVPHDEATDKSQPVESENTIPELETQWLGTGQPESKKPLQDAGATVPNPWPPSSTDVNPPGSKAWRLDTETTKPFRNTTHWKIRPESNDNKARWSNSGVKPVNKAAQWQNVDVTKRENENWRAPNPVEPGNKPQRRDTDTPKPKDKNEPLETTISKPKKQTSNQQEIKSSNEYCNSEPILMNLPKGKLVMTKLSVVEKLSVHHIEEGRVKVLSNVREPDDQNCYLFIPDAKNYPEVLENLLEVVLREADTTLFVV